MSEIIKEIEFLTKKIKQNPNSLLLGRLADSYLKLEIFDKAKLYCRTILQRFPENISTRIVYAKALILTNEHEKAIEELNTLKKIAPNLSRIYQLEAEVSKKLGNSERYLDLLEIAFEKDNFNVGLKNEIEIAFIPPALIKPGPDELMPTETLPKTEEIPISNEEIKSDVREKISETLSKLLEEFSETGTEKNKAHVTVSDIKEPDSPKSQGTLEVFHSEENKLVELPSEAERIIEKEKKLHEELIKIHEARKLEQAQETSKNLKLNDLKTTKTDENFLTDAETKEVDENFLTDAKTKEVDENFLTDAETKEVDENFLTDAETKEVDENFLTDAKTKEVDENFLTDAETKEVDENFLTDAETKEVELSPLERLKAIRKAKEKNDTEALNKLSGFNEQDFENDSELPELDETSQNKIIDPKFGITNIDDFQSILNETLKLNPKEEVQEDFSNLYELEPKEETKVVSPEPKPSKPALDSRGQINSPLLVRIYVEQELYGKAIDLLENRKKTEKTDKYDSEIEKYKKLLAEQKEAEKKSKR